MTSLQGFSRSSVQKMLLLKIGLVTLCVIGVAVFFLWRRDSMMGQVLIMDKGQQTLMKISSIRDIPLKDVRSGKISRLPLLSHGRLRLLIFLTSADCSACLAELPQWRFLSEATSQHGLDVDLIFVYSTEQEVASFLHSYDLPYGAFMDDSGKAASTVGIPPKTPVFVLVDPQYAVLAAQSATNAASEQRIFIDKVRSISAAKGP
jgi:hypothetical protein